MHQPRASSDGAKRNSLPTTRISSRPRTASNSSTISDSDANSGLVTYSREIREAIASLTREFQLPIKLSSSEVDKPAIEEVMNIYLAEGHKWADETKLALIKVLPLIKTTPSSRIITSNHNIWRQVVYRKEGWNWAYWIAFRAIYGKEILGSRHPFIRNIEEKFPGTNIWTANTPVAFPPASSSVKDDIWAFTSATPPATLNKTPNSDPLENKRKRPNHDLVTGGGGQRQGMAPKAKRHSHDNPITTITPCPSSSAPAVSKQNTPTQKDGPDAKETIADCITVATCTLVTPAVKAAPQTGIVVLDSPEFAQVDAKVATCVVATPTTHAAKTRETLAASGQSSLANQDRYQREKLEETVERARMYEQIKQELTDEFANKVQHITERVDQQSVLVGYVAQIFENIIDIKSRLDHLEEVSEARARIAATYSIPSSSGRGAVNLHSAIEALGHQVDYCTRSIHELKTGQPYEDDPNLLNIKQEPVQRWETDASH